MQNINVSIRVRPFNSRELKLNTDNVVLMDQPSKVLSLLDVEKKAAPRQFAFDQLFWSFDTSQPVATQEEVFNEVGQPAVTALWEGFHSTILAYGQTGSGKTYTLFGSDSCPGIIPLFCKSLFSQYEQLTAVQKKNTSITVSCLEIYNEVIHDLINPKNPAKLQVRQSAVFGVFVPDLTACEVDSPSKILSIIDLSHKNRTIASTKMNNESSRSHSVIKISLKRLLDDGISEVISECNLVDLAGSERQSKTEATGARLKEAQSINKSLLALGNVISKLSEASKYPNKQVFVSYRESVLTYLLSNSLGGNSKTFLICAISPASDNHSETLSALQFSNRAKQITVTPKVNICAKTQLIEDLKKEIQMLKENGPNADEKNQLVADYQQLLDDFMSEKELRVAQTNQIIDQSKKILEDSGVSFSELSDLLLLDKTSPFLLNLSLSMVFGSSSDMDGIFMYLVSKDAETTIGNSKNCNICLENLVSTCAFSNLHCTISPSGNNLYELKNNSNSITAINDSFLDANQIKILNSGDLIFLDNSLIFVFVDPRVPAADVSIDHVIDCLGKLKGLNTNYSKLISDITQSEIVINQSNFLFKSLALPFDCSLSFSLNSDESDVSVVQVRIVDFSVGRIINMSLDSFLPIFQDLKEAQSIKIDRGLSAAELYLQEVDLLAALTKINDELIGTCKLKLNRDLLLSKGTYFLEVKLTNLKGFNLDSEELKQNPSLCVEYVPIIKNNILTGFSFGIGKILNLETPFSCSVFVQFSLPHPTAIENTSRICDLTKNNDLNYFSTFEIPNLEYFYEFLEEGVPLLIFGHSKPLNSRPTQEAFDTLIEVNKSLEKRVVDLEEQIDDVLTRRCCGICLCPKCCCCSMM
ncbi:hypothetical protein RCL1_001835 [Eukaryota sp. TZLM3-RCL]